MSIPVSSGIGTGAAQVYDFGLTNRALDKAVDYSLQESQYQKQLKQRQAEIEADKEAKKKLSVSKYQQELAYDPTKINLADRDLYKRETEALLQKYSGRWEDVTNGGEAYMEFAKDLNKLKVGFANSMDTRVALAEKFADVEKNPSAYDSDQIIELQKIAETEGFVWDSQAEQMFAPKPEIGDLAGDLSETLKQIWYKPEFYNETDGSVSSATGDIFKSDEDSFNEFKKQLKALPKEQTRIRRFYNTPVGEDITEEQLKEMHDLSKARLPQFRKVINKTKEKEEGVVGLYNNKNWNVNTTTDKRGNTVLTMTKKTGGLLEVTDQVAISADGQEKVYFQKGKVEAVKTKENSDGSYNVVVSLSGKAVPRASDGNGFEGEASNRSSKDYIVDELLWQQISTTLGINMSLDEYMESTKPMYGHKGTREKYNEGERSPIKRNNESTTGTAQTTSTVKGGNIR